ncbi:MAG: hypothetical protein HY791_01650 [Deltaproteobacteria bacterium]|nr:hypothetical protein [Deltaproteobacteria bacterium]
MDPEDGWIVVDHIEPMRQKEKGDCGPTALAMVLRYWRSNSQLDLDPTVDHAAGELRDLAKRKGLAAYLIKGSEQDVKEQLEKKRPLVAGLVKRTLGGRASHYEVVAGYNAIDHRVATIDPGLGRWLVNSWEGFEREWAPAGNLLLLVARRVDPTGSND